MKGKKIVCQSGSTGWQKRLRKVYKNFNEFISYSSCYRIHQRLGYLTPEAAWRHNPLCQGSVYPQDLCKIGRQGQRIFARIIH